MSRVDRVPKRLKKLEAVLRGADALTVGELCLKLKVSRRTAIRDLNSLRDQGMPITAEPGRGGGIRYERVREGCSVSFSSDEVVALWLTSHLGKVASGLPWNDAAQAGLQRLFSSLPRSRMRELRALCRRVVVGNLASADVRAGASAPPPELLGIFEHAFTHGNGLGFHYVDRNGKRSVRRVEPHGLLVEPPVWYVLAIDCESREGRTFRMDRISRPRPLPEVRFVPDHAVVKAQTAHVK